MKTVNYIDFRSNIKHWLDKVINDVSDIIITRKGRKNLILKSVKELEAAKGIAEEITI